jgi:cation transport ATPase
VTSVFFLSVGVSDAVRPEAAFVVRSLHKRGVACYMITGDETATALVRTRLFHLSLYCCGL